MNLANAKRPRKSPGPAYLLVRCYFAVTVSAYVVECTRNPSVADTVNVYVPGAV